MKQAFLSVVLAITSLIGWSQQSTSVAMHIAQKMKDTLSLTEMQKENIYSINMDLQNRKLSVRAQSISQDSIRIKTQWIENSRDSLYSSVLPFEKYQIYKTKKRFLVSNN